MLANRVFWRFILFYTHLLLLLQPSVMRLSIDTFNDEKPPPKWILREFDVSRIRPRLGGLLHIETFTIKTRDYMDRRVTPPKRVTSPSRSWGPPLPCKQSLKYLGGDVKPLVLPHRSLRTYMDTDVKEVMTFYSKKEEGRNRGPMVYFLSVRNTWSGGQLVF